MRLCLICTSLRAGGTERVVSFVANHFSGTHDIFIVVLSSSEPFYELDPAIRVFRPHVARRKQSGWGWYPKMLSHVYGSLRQARPDLTLCFGEGIAPFILPVTTLSGHRTLVFNRASPLTSLSGKRGILNPLTYPLAQRVVVQTRRSIELMERRYRFSRFEVLPNPVTIPANLIEMPLRQRRIVNVGTMGGRKNQQALIRAFSASSHRSGWRLDLIGDGPDRARLESLCVELGVSGQVNFLGQRQDVPALLRRARIFAFPSLTEGFPNALAEALAAGCACVSYDCPTGPSDLIEDGRNGLLVPNDDEAAFSRQLQRLISDEALQARLGRQARKDIERFSEERVMQRFDELIAGALGQDPRRKIESCDS